jgi:hypothetical protein
MSRRATILVALALAISPLGIHGASPKPASRASAAEAPGAAAPTGLPLAFEKNVGQTDARVGYVARGRGYALFLTPDEAVIALSGARPEPRDAALGKSLEPLRRRDVLRMRWLGASTSSTALGAAELPGKANYLIGDDSKKWHTDVPTFAAIRYANVYAGIDIVFYGNQGELEYDFVVAPGADPGAVALKFDGAQQARVDDGGDLVLTVGGREIRQHRPTIYQRGDDGERRHVGSRYELSPDGVVRIEVAAYDAERELVIDPVLAYATYLGGGTSFQESTNDQAYDVAVDGAGHAYVVGYTDSADFPTRFALDATFDGDIDAFVVKLGAPGNFLEFSTYIGGSFSDYMNSVAVDAAGSVYVTGVTISEGGFPVTAQAYDPVGHGGGDCFAMKIASDGSAIVYSTLLGGTGYDVGIDIEVDGAGSAYIGGETQSFDFPVQSAFDDTPNGDDEGRVSDVFVTKLNAAGSALVYSTYLGGTWIDQLRTISLGGDGSVFVAGFTLSVDFPTINAFDETANGDYDAYVAKLQPTGSDLAFSTYLGSGGSDFALGSAVDDTGALYVTGTTGGSDFPVQNGFDESIGGSDAFLTKFTPDGGALSYSTFLGGSSSDTGFALALHSDGSVVVVGSTASTDFPTLNAYDVSANGSSDAFATKVNPSGTGLVFSTYLGGSSHDSAANLALGGDGAAYVVGFTQSTDFPTVSALDGSLNGQSDAFVTKLAPSGSSLLYSTYLGGRLQANGRDEASGIAVDAQGSIYVVGATDAIDFPTQNPLQPDYAYGILDAYVAKLSPSGDALAYATYVGGNLVDLAEGVAVDSSGSSQSSIRSGTASSSRRFSAARCTTRRRASPSTRQGTSSPRALRRARTFRRSTRSTPA